MRGDLEPANRQFKNAQITIAYRWKRIVANLKEAGVKSLEDKQWTRYLRTYYEDNRVVLKCGD